jgi:hypothetical protein
MQNVTTLRTRARAPTHARTHARAPPRMHIRMRARPMHARARTHAHAHTHMPAHTHTHTRTHTQSSCLTVGLYLPKMGWSPHIDQHPNGFEHMCILILILYVCYVSHTHKDPVVFAGYINSSAEISFWGTY